MMAHNTMLIFPASSMIGDNDAQLVTGDVGAPHSSHLGRPVLSFDDTEEEAAVTPEMHMPGSYGGGTLKATVHFYMASDNTNDVAIDVFVEAKTPDTDTLDMETASSWDSANSGTVSLSGSTAGDPLSMTITLTNKDSLAANDLVRFGVRRDTDSANDDASGDLYLAALEIWEDA
jgi:hypothetical protein